jgi:hypothetical protein
MGLDCSHNAFHGAYSAFNRFRQAVCFALGGSFPPHWKHNPDFSITKGPNDEFTYDRTLDEGVIYFGRYLDEDSGLAIFLKHSDCDGEISPEDCTKVADELESLLPEIEKYGMGGGHISARGGYADVARKFIGGCREAAKSNEPLIFA